LDPKLCELIENKLSKAELVSVAKDLEDFQLGVKGLSNLVIAGYPWTLF